MGGRQYISVDGGGGDWLVVVIDIHNNVFVFIRNRVYRSGRGCNNVGVGRAGRLLALRMVAM